MNSLKKVWRAIFKSNHFSDRELNLMSHNEFEEECNKFRAAGIEPSLREYYKMGIPVDEVELAKEISFWESKKAKPARIEPPKSTPFRFNSGNINPVSATSVLKSEQDREYERAIQETLEMQNREYREKMLKDELEKASKIREEKEKEQMIRDKETIEFLADNLPDEPETGIIIAVSLPNKTRIIRKFRPQEKGELLYNWIAGNPSLFEDNIRPIPFCLQPAYGASIVKELSLEEQGIKGKILLQTVLE